LTGRLLVVVALASLSVTSCSRRGGLNFSCQWVDTAPFPLDLRSEAHVRHLMDDIRVAEELAIRYGDRLAGWRLVETFGVVSRHGGVKDRDAGRRAQQECTSTLLRTIGSTHAVTEADINNVRPRLQQRGLDLPVTIPVVVLLLFAVRRFGRWLATRFDADERLGWLVATLFGSFFVPVLVVAAGGAWAVLVEIVQVGNEHLAHRARGESLRANLLVMFGIGVAAVWIGSATARRARSRNPTPV
jgi:hypothetical protein